MTITKEILLTLWEKKLLSEDISLCICGQLEPNCMCAINGPEEWPWDELGESAKNPFLSEALVLERDSIEGATKLAFGHKHAVTVTIHSGGEKKKFTRYFTHIAKASEWHDRAKDNGQHAEIRSFGEGLLDRYLEEAASKKTNSAYQLPLHFKVPTVKARTFFQAVNHKDNKGHIKGAILHVGANNSATHSQVSVYAMQKSGHQIAKDLAKTFGAEQITESMEPSLVTEDFQFTEELSEETFLDEKGPTGYGVYLKSPKGTLKYVKSFFDRREAYKKANSKAKLVVRPEKMLGQHATMKEHLNVKRQILSEALMTRAFNAGKHVGKKVMIGSYKNHVTGKLQGHDVEHKAGEEIHHLTIDGKKHKVTDKHAPIHVLEGSEEDNSPDIFLNEETGEEYYIEYDAETLQERRIRIRVNNRGIRTRKIVCGPGFFSRSQDGRTMCVRMTGRQRQNRKLATRKRLRTLKSKGPGARRKANFKRQRAFARRKAMGLRV